MAKSIQTKHHEGRTSLASIDPDELKSIVRDGLLSMDMDEREDFVRALAIEMRRANLMMSAYLIPLGIPGRVPEDLTPTEVGHLIRFFKINVPQAMPSVEQAMESFSVFAEELGQVRWRLAA